MRIWCVLGTKRGSKTLVKVTRADPCPAEWEPMDLGLPTVSSAGAWAADITNDRESTPDCRNTTTGFTL